MNTLRNFVTHFFQRHYKFLALSSIFFITLIAYGNSLSNSFHFDDMAGIVQNPTIRDLRNIPSYFTDPSTFAMGDSKDWRPVLQITYALNYFMAGPNPTVFRIFNLLFHVGTAFLIFLAVTELLRRFPFEVSLKDPLPGTLPALLCSLLFAVHTVNSEAVDYIWARSSVLAALFFILAFYCFLRGPFNATNVRKPLWQLAGLTFFALGIATKATTVTLPATLVLYEILFLNPDRKGAAKLFLLEPRRLRKYLPVVAVLIGYLAIRLMLLPGMFTRFIAPSPVTRSANVVTPYSYLLTQFRAWIYYLRLFFWPHPLMVDFSNFGWSHSIWEPRVLLSLGLIAVILIVGWCSRKTQPLISFFTYWFFIALLPEASFIPLADAVVGYRAYLANIGPSIVITLLSLKGWTWIWSKAQRSHQPRKLLCSISYAIIAGIILTALIVSTVSRNRDWRDEVTLWSDVISKDPVNARAYMGLGTQFLHQRDYGKAQQMFEKAIQFGPRTADAYALRGYLRAIQRKTAEALSDFTTAIKLDPRSPYTFAYRGDLYNRTGELDEAIADFKRAIALHPFYNDAYFGLAMAYVGKEDIANAMTACAQLVKIDNGDRRGYDCLGTLLIDQNRFVDAVKLYEQGIAQIPEDGELWQSLGTAYQKAGRDAEANQAFAKASLLMNGVNRQAP